MPAAYPNHIVFLLLVIGLLGLWGGTDLVVRNAVLLAQRLRVSELFIGLTVLALGTDLPELVVAIDGALHNLRGIPSSGVVVGTAVGSSIGQISLVIGVTAILHYITIGPRQLRLLGVELIASVGLFFLVARDGQVDSTDGLILLFAFATYIGYTVAARQDGVGEDVDLDGDGAQRKPWWALLLLLIGLGVVVASSELTVDQAVALSRGWGLQQSFVGAVIIGIGTSLPELAVSARAILEGRAALSVGNVAGSNIFDLLVPVGVAAVISPLAVDETVIWFDLPWLLATTVVVLFFLARKKGLQRWEGGALLAVYVVYAVLRFAVNGG
jgi:cation:H+ antiporter